MRKLEIYGSIQRKDIHVLTHKVKSIEAVYSTTDEDDIWIPTCNLHLP